MSSDDPGIERGGSRFLTLLGWGAVLAGAGNYMLFSKSSPKYELFHVQFSDDTSLTATMSDVDAASLVLVLAGAGLLWLGRPRAN